jgi:hypothetical protein
MHTWSDENPHSIQETCFQHQFAINVWLRIIGDLIGPYELLPCLRGLLFTFINGRIASTTGTCTIDMTNCVVYA